MFRRLWNFLFPPDPWAQCEPPTEAQRLAMWERRRGEYLAEQRLRQARVSQLIDMRASVRRKITPMLPD